MYIYVYIYTYIHIYIYMYIYIYTYMYTYRCLRVYIHIYTHTYTGVCLCLWLSGCEVRIAELQNLQPWPGASPAATRLETIRPIRGSDRGGELSHGWKKTGCGKPKGTGHFELQNQDFGAVPGSGCALLEFIQKRHILAQM